MRKTMKLQSANLQTVGGWVGRLLRLDLSVLDEIRAQPSATTAAVGVVLAASVLAGVGSWLWAVLVEEPVSAGEVFIKSLLLGSIIQTMVWFLWVYLTSQVLVRAYGARTDFAQLIRTMGFAFAPVALNLLVAIGALAVPLDRKSTRL